MRRLALASTLLLLPAVAHAQTTAPFRCEERAFDLTACTDPSDLDTCPRVCSDPNDPATCAVLPLPELSSLTRQSDAQPILRQAGATGGAYTGVTITMIARSDSEDTRFRSARDRLCVAPPPPLVCSDPDDPSGGGVGIGRIWYGGNPGIYLFVR
jgi:hypothetical protein